MGDGKANDYSAAETTVEITDLKGLLELLLGPKEPKGPKGAKKPKKAKGLDGLEGLDLLGLASGAPLSNLEILLTTESFYQSQLQSLAFPWASAKEGKKALLETYFGLVSGLLSSGLDAKVAVAGCSDGPAAQGSTAYVACSELLDFLGARGKYEGSLIAPEDRQGIVFQAVALRFKPKRDAGDYEDVIKAQKEIGASAKLGPYKGLFS